MSNYDGYEQRSLSGKNDIKNNLNCGRVAQLDRVPGYEPGGRRFDSCRVRHISL